MLNISPRKPSNGDAPSKSDRNRNQRNQPAPAPNIGAILRERREAMGVTLAEAEVATRIRQKYLSALESDEWDLLPGEVVGRGFLRNYATYLGLEGGEMIDRRRTVADDSLAAALVNTSAGAPMPPERKVDYRPKDVMLKEEGDDLDQPRPLSLAPFFTLGALALVAVLAWLAVTQVAPNIGDWNAAIQEQVAAFMPKPAPTATATSVAATAGELAAVSPTGSAAGGTDDALSDGIQAAETTPAVAGGESAVATVTAAVPLVVVDPTPTATEAAAAVPLSLPTPTPAPTPEPLPPTPVPIPATANTAANLRETPSTEAAVVGASAQGETLAISGQNSDGTWYQLASGSWIFGQLVDNAPANLPIVDAAAPLPTATPLAETVEPTATAAPVVVAAACADQRVVITSPGVGQLVAGVIQIEGTASHEAFSRYDLSVAPGDGAAGGFFGIGGASSPVAGGQLGTWDTTSVANGPYTIQLTVVDTSGNFPAPCPVAVTVQN